MKMLSGIFAIWLAASAWAQSPPPKPQTDSHASAKPSGAQAALPKASAASAPAKTAAVAMSQPANGKAAIHVAPPLSAFTGKQNAGAKVGHPSSAPAVSSRLPRKGRDPFVSPVRQLHATAESCTGSGRQCLAVNDVSLQGIVRFSGGFIAVVMNGDRTYFLRQNDPLADGDVERITKDAIILRQRSSDVLGRTVTREVTRKLGTPAV